MAPARWSGSPRSFGSQASGGGWAARWAGSAARRWKAVTSSFLQGQLRKSASAGGGAPALGAEGCTARPPPCAPGSRRPATRTHAAGRPGSARSHRPTAPPGHRPGPPGPGADHVQVLQRSPGAVPTACPHRADDGLCAPDSSPMRPRRRAARSSPVARSATSLVTGTTSAVAMENSVSTVGLPVPCSSLDSVCLASPAAGSVRPGTRPAALRESAYSAPPRCFLRTRLSSKRGPKSGAQGLKAPPWTNACRAPALCMVRIAALLGGARPGSALAGAGVRVPSGVALAQAWRAQVPRGLGFPVRLGAGLDHMLVAVTFLDEADDHTFRGQTDHHLQLPSPLDRVATTLRDPR
jgi:hypothetical protein